MCKKTVIVFWSIFFVIEGLLHPMIVRHNHAHSQLKFEKTASTLCSTACVVWLTTLMKFNSSKVVLTDGKIDKILTFADQIHQILQNQLKLQNRMLAVDEIMEFVPTTFKLNYSFFFGHSLLKHQQEYIPSDMINMIHLNDLQTLFGVNEGGVFTCNHHNVAIYCCSNNLYLIFDSLPACTYELSANDLQKCLVEIFVHIDEFNLFVFQNVDVSASESTS